MATEAQSMYAAAAAAAVLAVLWFSILYLRLYRRPSPRRLPGPSGLPLVGSLPFLDPELHTYFASLSSTYGPIFGIRLGLTRGVVVSSAALAREILREQDTVFANRDVPAAAKVIAYGGRDVVWTPHGPTLRLLRKVCVQSLLGSHTLDALYGLRRKEMRGTITRIHQKAGEAVNVGEEMFLTALNVITEMMWGGSVAEETADVEAGRVAEEFRALVGEITALLGAPNLSDFFPALRALDLQGVEKRARVARDKFDAIFERLIQRRVARRSSGGGGGDFLDLMLKMEGEVGEEGKAEFTRTNLKALLMDMVVGGTDTTSNTVEWAMAEMLAKPETLRKAQAEVDAVVGGDTAVEESHARDLPYLSAVVKEVLRLHPALPLLVPHCPSQDTTVGGYAVPAGSRVFVNVWAIHRDPAAWEDPSEFRPERFLGESGRECWDYSGRELGYFPFGSGRRICAGIGMAERTVMYALASFVHCFEWRAAEESVDLEEKFGIVLKKAKPLVAVPTPRLHTPELYS